MRVDGQARRSRVVKIVEALVSRACDRQAVGTTASTKAQSALFNSGRLVFAMRSSLRLRAR